MDTSNGTAGSKTRITVFLLEMLGLSILLSGCGPETEQAGFLACWSTDESRVALVSNFMADGNILSGVWIYDARIGETKQIVRVASGFFCAHPQWSPTGRELMFAVLRKDDENSENDKDEMVPYSLWIAGANGEGLRRIRDSSTIDNEAFLLPNAIMWGWDDSSIIFQQTVGTQVTALQQNLLTGDSVPYLPDSADAYSLTPSPDRNWIAALLCDKDSRSARLYLAHLESADWRLVTTLGMDAHDIESLSPMIYWAPNSSGLIVTETEGGITGESRYLCYVDAGSGTIRRIGTGDPQSSILWNRESNSLLFTSVDGKDSANVVIRRLDLLSGKLITLAPYGENHLLSWNHEDNRIYFYQGNPVHTYRSPKGRIEEQRLFSCRADGSDARSLGHFDIRESLSGSLSRTGNRMVLFHESDEPGVVDFTTGDTRRIRLQ